MQECRVNDRDIHKAAGWKGHTLTILNRHYCTFVSAQTLALRGGDLDGFSTIFRGHLEPDISLIDAIYEGANFTDTAGRLHPLSSFIEALKQVRACLAQLHAELLQSCTHSGIMH
jgi:hypothetical protein